MNNRVDFEGVFHLLQTHRAVRSGYRPQHSLHQNYLSSGIHVYPERQLVEPGEAAQVQVCLITPSVYPCCIWEGRSLSIFEGSRLVGTLRVDRIINETLRVASELYKPWWEAPVHLDNG
jgi:translation elongation factor EF-Tu-like GTPase